MAIPGQATSLSSFVRHFIWSASKTGEFRQRVKFVRTLSLIIGPAIFACNYSIRLCVMHNGNRDRSLERSGFLVVCGRWMTPIGRLWSGGRADKIVKSTGWGCRLCRWLNGRASISAVFAGVPDSILGRGICDFFFFSAKASLPISLSPFPSLSFPFDLLLALNTHSSHSPHIKVTSCYFLSYSLCFLPVVLVKASKTGEGTWCYTHAPNIPVDAINGKDFRQDPLDLSFGHFLIFLHHGKEEVETHLLWKFHKKFKEKVGQMCHRSLLAYIRFLYKVVHQNGGLRKFNRSHEIAFNFFIAWTIFMKLGTLVYHVHGYKKNLRFFYFLPMDLVMGFQSRKTEVESSLNFQRA